MKSNQLKELHTKTVDELTRELRDLKAEIVKQENEWVHGKLKNTNLIRGIRKDVARYMTVLHTKGMEPVVTADAKAMAVKEQVETVEKKVKKVKEEKTS